MAKQRATFGKLQRERDKQAKQAAKRERRIGGKGDEEPTPSDEAPTTSEEEQGAILSALAALHEAYEDGQMSVEDFEARRDELRTRLRID